MNPRIAGWIGSALTLLGGVFALLSPEQALPWLGFRAVEPLAWTLGEVRATYGALFVVLGAFGVHAALDPPARRSRLIMIGGLWWSVAAGRALGAWIDGSPGMFAWIYLACEVALGGLFVVAATASDRTPSPSITNPAPV